MIDQATPFQRNDRVVPVRTREFDTMNSTDPTLLRYMILHGVVEVGVGIVSV